MIQRPRYSRMKRDCISSGHLSIIDPVTSVLENVVGLHHPKVIGTDSPVINPVTSVVKNVVGLYHPWTLSPKVIQILFVFELCIVGCC